MTKALMRGQITLDSVKRVLEDERFAICASEEPLSCGGKIMVDDAVCLVINTSGSTASPKRVAFSSSSLMNSARACCSVLGYGQWVLCLPKQYTAGVRVLVRSILSGTKPIDISEDRFSLKISYMHAGGYLARIPLLHLSQPSSVPLLGWQRMTKTLQKF